MKYYIYNYKDIKLKVFDAPIFSPESPDVFAEKVERSLKVVKPFDYQFAKDKALYSFGSFDDVEGKFEFLDEPICLLLTNEVLPIFEVVIDNYKALNVRDQRNDEVLYRHEFNIEREKLRLAELEKQKGGVA